MAAVRIHRFVVDPADEAEFLVRRAEAITTIRAQHPGLSEARLIRLEGGAFIDAWRWNSAEEMQAALAAAPSFADAARAAMSLTRDATSEDGEIIDER